MLARFPGRPRGRRSLVLAVGFLAALFLAPELTRNASADDFVDLTLLFHGSVQGKIAPCG